MSAEPDASDVSTELNQLELPEEFDEADLAAIQAELNSSGLRADVMVVPTSAARFHCAACSAGDPFPDCARRRHCARCVRGRVLGRHQGGVRRLQPGNAAGQSQRARVTVRYKDGPAIEIDVATAEQLRQLLNDIVPPDQRLPEQA
jgi:hypothetical protein